MTKDTNAYLFESPWILERRFFGFSNNLLDLFGFGFGIISALPLYYSSAKKEYKILLSIPFLLLTCVLNSRTGLLIFAIGVFVWIVELIISKTVRLSMIIKWGMFFSMMAATCFGIVSMLSPRTIEWISKDFSSFIGDDSSYGTATSIYSERFWTIPDDGRVLVGTGHNVSAYSSSKVDSTIHSDNGYINEIWKAGIIGLLLFVTMNYLIIRHSYCFENDYILKAMFVFFGVSMIVFMVKASLTGYNPGNAIIYSLFIYSFYNDKEVLHEKR